MSTSITKSSIQARFQHIPVLRDYARRSILLGQTLPPHEENDKADRVQQFLSTGHNLN